MVNASVVGMPKSKFYTLTTKIEIGKIIILIIWNSFALIVIMRNTILRRVG